MTIHAILESNLCVFTCGLYSIIVNCSFSWTIYLSLVFFKHILHPDNFHFFVCCLLPQYVEARIVLDFTNCIFIFQILEQIFVPFFFPYCKGYLPIKNVTVPPQVIFTSHKTTCCANKLLITLINCSRTVDCNSVNVIFMIGSSC